MSDHPVKNEKAIPIMLQQKIEAKVERKIKAKKKSKETLLHGFSVMGIVGWSVAIPILLGVALGIYLDHRFAASFSWTLSLLMIGLVIGCLNAWFWISKEGKAIEKEEVVPHE